MKKMLFILVLTFMGVNLSAQGVDDVTLVVSGDGPTKEQATHVALRSAVEQAYGVFVSANTEILNDELVKDEIATVTSGNVKSFKELNSNILPNGNHMVVLQAVVSTKQLAAYAQSKGASCEFAGATFKANLMLIELNKLNTKKAFENMLTQLKAFVPYLYERKLSIGTPDINGNIDFYIDYYMNDAVWACRDIIISTCSALNISEEELQNLKAMKTQVYEYSIDYDELYFSGYSWSKKSDSEDSSPLGNLFEVSSNIEKTIYTYNFYYPFPNIFEILNIRLYIADNLNDIYSIIPIATRRPGFLLGRGAGVGVFDCPCVTSFQEGENPITFNGGIYSSCKHSLYRSEDKDDLIRLLGFDPSIFTTDTYFTCSMFTNFILPKKKKQKNISLPKCKTRLSSKISVQIDPERLGKISNFELKQVPDNMKISDLLNNNNLK